MTQELLLPRRQAGELRRGWFLVRQRGRALLAAASRWERRLLIASADGTLAHFLEAPRGGLVQAGAPLDLGTLELHPAYSAADEQASCRPQHARYPGGEPAHHVVRASSLPRTLGLASCPLTAGSERAGLLRGSGRWRVSPAGGNGVALLVARDPGRPGCRPHLRVLAAAAHARTAAPPQRTDLRYAHVHGCAGLAADGPLLSAGAALQALQRQLRACTANDSVATSCCG
eukprot:scaffold1691_cov378-Prasinococcus_capsulatus_cf.AAC.6